MEFLTYMVIAVAIITVYKVVSSLYGRKTGYDIAPNSLRFLAWFYDMMLIHILVFLITCFYLLYIGTFKVTVLGYISYIVNEVGYGVLRSDWYEFEVKIFIVYLIYSFIFEAFTKKGTIGKQSLRIEFEQKIGFGKSLIRNLFKAISVVGFPVFMILSRLNSNRFWIHDLFFKTKILKIL